MAKIEWRGKNKDIAYLSWAEGGKQPRRSIGRVTKACAEAVRLEKERELNSTLLRFDMFAQDYLEWHSREYPASHERIDKIFEHHLLPYFAGFNIEEINELNIEGYKGHRLSGKIISPSEPRKIPAADTINKELRSLMALFNRAVRWKKIDRNPITELPLIRNLNSKPPHFYSSDDLEELYKHSNNFHHIWQFLANNGLRRAEYLKFDPNVNIKKGNFYIESTNEQRTKSGKWRMVPISKGADTAMKGEYLYEGRKESLSRAFAKCADRAGLPGSLHSLRHTFCSHLVMKSVPLRTVQILAGHSSSKTTEIYAHLAPDYLVDSVQDLDI